MSLYRSDTARQRVLAGYQQQLARLDTNIDAQALVTRTGTTQVYCVGDATQPPLLILPGLQTPAPFMLELMAPLADQFRLYCPDLPGQVGLSAEVAPARVGGYGGWVHELLDALELGAVAAVGFSFGGAVLLDAARLQPQRIKRVSLLMPAGISVELLRPLKRFLLPWLRYKFNASDANFQRLMQPLMGDNWPQLAAFYQQVFAQLTSVNQLPPGPFTPAQLADWQAPVQLVMAQRDAYFDAEKMSVAATRLLPHLVETVVLDDTHIPGPDSQQQLVVALRHFLLG